MIGQEIPLDCLKSRWQQVVATLQDQIALSGWGLPEDQRLKLAHGRIQDFFVGEEEIHA